MQSDAMGYKLRRDGGEVFSAFAWYSRSFTKYERTCGASIPDPSRAASVRALSKIRFDHAYGM